MEKEVRLVPIVEANWLFSLADYSGVISGVVVVVPGMLLDSRDSRDQSMNELITEKSERPTKV